MSLLATVRHRTIQTKGAHSQKTSKLIVSTLVRAQKWRQLNCQNQLPHTIEGGTFTDGVAQTEADEPRAAPSSRITSIQPLICIKARNPFQQGLEILTLSIEAHRSVLEF
ncbi:hypothetical protein [Pseudooceanicola atlanticus]|uniref:hypothetical protein n=1 Tax=Pseudooceanicola atlanticus TaxID=1461694 RepID=UPI0012E00AE4